MIANTAFLAAVTVFLIVAWLAGELSFLAPYKTALFRLHGMRSRRGDRPVLPEPVRRLLQAGAVLFLRDTGRKLTHLDRQLGTADGVIDELRHQLKR